MTLLFQLEAVCMMLEPDAISENNMLTFVTCLMTLTPEISYSNCVTFSSVCILPRVSAKEFWVNDSPFIYERLQKYIQKQDMRDSFRKIAHCKKTVPKLIIKSLY